MASLTAVELGADTCAFARTSVRRGEVHLSAAEVLDPAAFPGMDAFTIAVRQTRRSMRLPRRCRVVLWGLPDGANRKDAAVKPLLAPLANAGFRVDRVVTPCNALAALARLKTSRGEGSTCWLGINRGGVAIVVVRPGKLLYAHSFAWDSQMGASGSQARLLQRYSLVSFLSPEVKRAMAEARRSGTPVDAVVLCGNLPDLRSLTMPLIEELDVEVETLDSFEGLLVKSPLAEKLADSAPAIRLACAAAIARGTRPWDPSRKRAPSHAVTRYLSAAAIVAAILGVVYQWYGKPRNAAPPSLAALALSEPAPAASVPAKRAESNPPAVSVPPRSVVSAALPKITGPAPVATKPPVVTPALPRAKPPVVGVQSANLPPDPASAKATAGPPKPSAKAEGGNDTDGRGANARALPAATAATTVPPAVSVPAKRAESNPQTRIQPLFMMPLPNIAAPRASPTAPPAASASAAPFATKTGNPRADPRPPAPSPGPGTGVTGARPENRPPALNPPPVPADKPEAASTPGSSLSRSAHPSTQDSSLGRSGQGRPSRQEALTAAAPSPAGATGPRGPMPEPLKDAVPRVTAILISRDRRFATVDGGQIIGIGDLLGRRTLVGIDERSVVFQEPSGVQIRIGLGGRLLAVERAAR